MKFSSIWLQFLVSAVLIVLSGKRLTVYADKLSDKLSIGKVWIGIILLGMVTSFPEGVTSLVAVVSLNAVDLGLGNLLGSNNFNLMLIVLMDLALVGKSVTSLVKPNKSHNASSLFAIVLTLIIALDIFFGGMFSALRFGNLSLGLILVAVIYFVGIKILSSLGRKESELIKEEDDKAVQLNQDSLFKIWINIILCAAIVIIAAVLLASSADKISEVTGLGQTFVGSIFVAIVTSLPEMTVTLSALRIKSIDLALGNIFGSNMINMFSVFLCGLFYRGAAPILQSVSKLNAYTAFLGIALTVVAVIGLRIRNKKTYFRLGLDSILMIVLFIVVNVILYRFVI
ncbi:MAG: hypothetical protein P9X22_03125 [Candidatus Zapsychrus exili]|nr:hypothetical protein [Candidatus Zapsychrus exili]